jgi:hypothetical protein
MSNVYHVRWYGSGWQVRDQHDRTLSRPSYCQADGVIRAKELARHDGSAEIVVHDERGTVTSDFFYGTEEREALAYDDAPPTMAATHADRRDDED